MANINLNLNQNYFGTSVSGVSSLFSSLNNNSVSTLAGMLSDYNSIRSGAYGKLMKTYYGGNEKLNSTSDTSSDKTDKTKSESNTQLVSARDAAKSLKESVDKLTATGKDSVFSKKDVKKEDGTVKQEYDLDAVYKAVSSFVKDYNAMADAAGNSGNSSIINSEKSIMSLTAAMSKSLSKVGITVGIDNRLTIDEKAFKAADMSRVKSLFNGSSSYASQIASNASGIANTSAAKLAQINGTFYDSTGLYGSNYAYSGSLFTSNF